MNSHYNSYINANNLILSLCKETLNKSIPFFKKFNNKNQLMTQITNYIAIEELKNRDKEDEEEGTYK